MGLIMKTNITVEDTNLRPVFFVQIDFNGATMFVNSADRNITTLGSTWLGVSSIGSLGELTVKTGTQATSLKLTLTNIPGGVGSDVINENLRNTPVTIYIGFLDEHSQLIEDPALWFNGYVDSTAVSAGAIITASLSVTSRLINWAKSVNTRYTHEDQQSRFPKDEGFKFIAEIPKLRLMWGS